MNKEIRLEDLAVIKNSSRRMAVVDINQLPQMTKGNRFELLVGMAIILFEEKGLLTKNTYSCVAGLPVDERSGVDFIFGNYIPGRKVMGFDVTLKPIELKDNLLKWRTSLNMTKLGCIITLAVRMRNSYMMANEQFDSPALVISVTKLNGSEIGNNSAELWNAAQCVAATLRYLESTSLVFKKVSELFSKKSKADDNWYCQQSREYRKMLTALQ
ncbi:MAG: hypothetical protein IJI14_17630 [Anaerolineaceae bacterium]|nr:hypothetical protein [Anaerolineaceae bacterium]